jgi:beta-phosphoglucomutase family hydrolase/Cof subfamily protein (haloacid dehalogenase superfamily)
VKDLRLLVTDVDGTLVTGAKELTPRAIDAAHRLRRSGIDLAITSGRPPRGMAMLVGPLGITCPVAGFNGGMVVEPDLHTIIQQRTISLAVAREVVDGLLAAGLDVWVYRGHDWFVRDPGTPRVAVEQATVMFPPTVVADLHAVLDGAVKIIGTSENHDLVARAEAELRDRVGRDASAARSQAYYVDITHPDANKGMVVRDLSRKLEIPMSQIAAIGDMPTDVMMFGLVGVSIAMGNASLEVQRTARHVTTSNDDEGFANAVDRFILHGARPVQATLGLPSRVEACLFDLDGVLTQTSIVHAAAWKQTFDELLVERAAERGEQLVPFDVALDYTRYVDGKPREDGVRSFLASRGISASDAEVHAIGERKNQLVHQILHEHPVATYAGSVRYVHAARDAGLKTAVVSSSKNTQDVLRSAGIEDLFDVRIDGVVAEQRHLAGKPAPDTFLAAAEALAVDPARAVVFEDALAGVEAGHAGHFAYVVGVDRANQGAALRQHGADVVVTDLAALLEAA